MTKIWAALKVIWELWPYILKLVEYGKDWELRFRTNRTTGKIEAVFEKRSKDEEIEDTSQHASDLNDLFR